MINEFIVPNEILIRYDDDGKFQGAHVAYLKVLRDSDNKIIHRDSGSPQPIKSPLDPVFRNILGTALTDALVAHQDSQMKIFELEQKIEQKDTPSPQIITKNSPYIMAAIATTGLPAYFYVILHFLGVIN